MARKRSTGQKTVRRTGQSL